MKTQLKLVIFIFAALAVAEAARHVAAQGTQTQPQTQNPSQTTPGQNPSQTAPAQNPSQTVPGQNPSQPLPGQNAATQLPTVSGTAGSNAQADQQSVLQVRTAVTQAITASNGNQASGTNGIAVNDLRITALNGKVTLNGVVHTEKEKADAAARAATVVGTGNVVNEIIVR